MEGFNASRTHPTILATLSVASHDTTVTTTPLALGTSADKLLFEPNERGPANDLLLAFEAASTRLDQEGQDHLKATLEGLLLRAETRRWAS